VSNLAPQNKTEWAPVLASGWHWARRKARDHAPSGAPKPSQVHIANHAGRLLCDGGPSVGRGVAEPTLVSEVHALCLDVYRRARAT